MSYYLREISREDIPTINSWRNDPEIIENLGSPFRYVTKEVDDVWFSSYLGSRNSNIRLAIVEVERKKLIGATYLTGIDWVCRSAEFSIWIGASESQGKGAGRFATLGTLEHAFNNMGLHRVHLTVLSENLRARNLYKSIGFSEEGILRQAVFKKGEYKDMIAMSILSYEFKAYISTIK